MVYLNRLWSYRVNKDVQGFRCGLGVENDLNEIQTSCIQTHLRLQNAYSGKQTNSLQDKPKQKKKQIKIDFYTSLKIDFINKTFSCYFCSKTSDLHAQDNNVPLDHAETCFSIREQLNIMVLFNFKVFKA